MGGTNCQEPWLAGDGWHLLIGGTYLFGAQVFNHGVMAFDSQVVQTPVINHECHRAANVTLYNSIERNEPQQLWTNKNARHLSSMTIVELGRCGPSHPGHTTLIAYTVLLALNHRH
jgi:hypothetical protein